MTIKKCCDKIMTSRHGNGLYRDDDGTINIAYENDEYGTIDIIFANVRFCPYCGKRLEWEEV